MTGSPSMVLPSASASLALEPSKSVGGEELAQEDRLAVRVRQLDADGVLAGDDGDARGDGAHRAGDVVGEADDARGFDAGRRLQLVERDDRAGADVDDLAAHAEILEHAFEQPRVLLQRALVDRRVLARLLRRLGEEMQRRQLEIGGGQERRLRFLLGARARLRTRRPAACTTALVAHRRPEAPPRSPRRRRRRTPDPRRIRNPRRPDRCRGGIAARACCASRAVRAAPRRARRGAASWRATMPLNVKRPMRDDAGEEMQAGRGGALLASSSSSSSSTARLRPPSRGARARPRPDATGRRPRGGRARRPTARRRARRRGRPTARRRRAIRQCRARGRRRAAEAGRQRPLREHRQAGERGRKQQRAAEPGERPGGSAGAAGAGGRGSSRQSASGKTMPTTARPKNCMARSAKAAPGRPRRFCAGAVDRVAEARIVDVPGDEAGERAPRQAPSPRGRRGARRSGRGNRAGGLLGQSESLECVVGHVRSPRLSR